MNLIKMRFVMRQEYYQNIVLKKLHINAVIAVIGILPRNMIDA